MKTMRLLVIAALAVGILYAGSVFAEEGITIKISALEGNVLIKKAGSEDWIEAKVGDILGKGDSIKTSEDGSAYLETGLNAGFTMGHNSELVIGNTLADLPVAEPYTEAARESVENISPPAANQDASASGY